MGPDSPPTLPPCFGEKKEEMTEERKAGTASKVKSGLLLSSKTGFATQSITKFLLGHDLASRTASQEGAKGVFAPSHPPSIGFDGLNFRTEGLKVRVQLVKVRNSLLVDL